MNEGGHSFGRKVVVGRGVDFGDVVSARNDRGIGVRDVHRADSAEQAQALFEMLLEEQLYEYQQVENEAAYPLLQHEFLNNYFAVDRLGAYLYGVENAPEPDAVMQAMQKLKEALGG